MAAKTRRSYTGAPVTTTITAGINSTDTTITLSSATGWATGVFYAVLDPGTSSEEKVLVGSRSGTSLSITSRGVDGTTAKSHISGTTIYPVFAAVDADEANELTSTYTTQGSIVYQGASTFAERTIGTAGQVLKVNSGATAPEWGQVPTAGIADSAVTAAKIADGTVTADELASNSVTTVKIADDAVTSAKILAGAVGSSELANDSVITAKILDANITKAKLNDGASGDITLVTVSASAPFGGKNGDVWIVV